MYGSVVIPNRLRLSGYTTSLWPFSVASAGKKTIPIELTHNSGHVFTLCSKVLIRWVGIVVEEEKEGKGREDTQWAGGRKGGGREGRRDLAVG